MNRPIDLLQRTALLTLVYSCAVHGAATQAHDFIAETHSTKVRPLSDAAIPPLGEAQGLTAEIAGWMNALPEGSALVFPEGRYYVTAGFYLKNGFTLSGASVAAGSGETLTFQDKTVFVIHPRAPRRDELRAAKTIDLAARSNSLTALFYAQRKPADVAQGITVRGVTIELGAPEYPAPFEQNPERAPVPSAVRIENPSACVVEQVHVRNPYAAAISLSATRPGADVNYGKSPPCAPSPSHHVTRNQYAGKDASCSVVFLAFSQSIVRSCEVEAYRHLAKLETPGIMKPLYSPPHVVGIEISSPIDGPGKKLQEDKQRVANFPSFSVASALGETAVEKNRLLGGEYGVSVVNSVRNLVTDNYAAMNTHRGFSFQRGADYNLIRQNHAAGNGGSGIHIANDTDGNTVTRNKVDAAGFVTDEHGALERGADGSLQLLDGEGDGIKVYVNSSYTTISDNTVSNARHAGVRVGHNAIGTEVTNNVVSVDTALLQELAGVNLRIIHGQLSQHYLGLPVGMRLSAVFDEQRLAIPFGEEIYPADSPMAGFEKVQGLAQLASTKVVGNHIRGTWRGIVIGDDSAKHLVDGTESGVRPSVHDNLISGNEIELGEIPPELAGITVSGTAPPPDAPKSAWMARSISSFSFNDARAAGKGLACDPALRMANNKIEQNWEQSGSAKAAIDGVPAKVDSKIK